MLHRFHDRNFGFGGLDHGLRSGRRSFRRGFFNLLFRTASRPTSSPPTPSSAVSLVASRALVAPAEAVAFGAAEISAVAAGPEVRRQVLVIGRVHIRDVKETVAADAEIDKCGLNARLDVDDAALVDVADVALLAG